MFVLTDRDSPLPASPIKGEVQSRVWGLIAPNAPAEHLPLYGGGWEGAVCLSFPLTFTF
jgi:hypothetical protein